MLQVMSVTNVVNNVIRV